MSLQKIQQELKAPKNQFNSFGKYNYRSCEDILEGVKPLLEENGCVLTLSDEMVEVGGRVYVKATANFTQADGTQVVVSACAREPENRKGMDDSQITGATSSYARKYALNGLFCIDDTKDSDTQDNTTPAPTQQSASQPAAGATISEAQGKRLMAICSSCGVKVAVVANKFGFKRVGEVDKSRYQEICEWAENQKPTTPDDDIPF